MEKFRDSDEEEEDNLESFATSKKPSTNFFSSMISKFLGRNNPSKPEINESQTL